MMSRRRSRRLIPSFGMDALEIRAMLDAAPSDPGAQVDPQPSYDGSGEQVDPAVQAMFDEVEGFGAFSMVTPDTNIAGTYGDQASVIAAIEASRKKANKEFDTDIKAEKDRLAWMEPRLASYLQTTSQWPADWWHPDKLNANTWRWAKAEYDLYTWINEAKAEIKMLEAEKAAYNKAVDADIATIKRVMADTGQTDDAGNEIYYTYYYNDPMEFVFDSSSVV